MQLAWQNINNRGHFPASFNDKDFEPPDSRFPARLPIFDRAFAVNTGEADARPVPGWPALGIGAGR